MTFADLIVPVTGSVCIILLTFSVCFAIGLRALSKRDLDRAMAKAYEGGDVLGGMLPTLLPHLPKLLGFLKPRSAEAPQGQPENEPE